MLGWELPPYNSGGLGVACLNLSRALAKTGAKIDFVVPYTAQYQDCDFMNVLPATHVELTGATGAYDSTFVTDGSEIRHLQHEYCKFVTKYLADNHPDVIHAHDWLTFEAGILAKKHYGVPLVAHVHATEYDRSGMNGGNELVHAIEREGLTLADRIIAVSETTKNLIHEKYGIPLSKIDVAYNSLSDEFLQEKYNYDQADYPYFESYKKAGYTIVATVGRFTIQKGLWHMMQAAARALKQDDKLLFVFAGDGEERDELISLAAELGIAKNVFFTGFVRGKLLRDIYSMADIFVMSSISEPFGLTALEAAHYGDALILTKQSGVSEVLRSAISYDFWDEKKLADAIIAIAHSKALQQTLRASIKEEYRKISWDDVAQKCLSVYGAV